MGWMDGTERDPNRSTLQCSLKAAAIQAGQAGEQ